jgi:hypothetical protein
MSSREHLHSILARSGNVFPGLQAAQRFLVRLHRLMRVYTLWLGRLCAAMAVPASRTGRRLRHHDSLKSSGSISKLERSREFCNNAIFSARPMLLDIPHQKSFWLYLTCNGEGKAGQMDCGTRHVATPGVRQRLAAVRTSWQRCNMQTPDICSCDTGSKNRARHHNADTCMQHTSVSRS